MLNVSPLISSVITALRWHCVWLAGYTIHTVVALAHAGLIPLEHQLAVQQTFEQLAPVLNSSSDALLAVVDKSLPTMLGLGGEAPPPPLMLFERA